MVLAPIIDTFFFSIVFLYPCAVGVWIVREMLAFDGEVSVVAQHLFRLGSILGLGAIPWRSTLSLLMSSCGANKAYSSNEVVCAEVVLWRWWVWSVEIERALRVRCLGS